MSKLVTLNVGIPDTTSEKMTLIEDLQADKREIRDALNSIRSSEVNNVLEELMNRIDDAIADLEYS